MIEAIVEQLVAEAGALPRRWSACVGPTAILASNTSSLSIAALGGACQRGERVLGIHFFNPAAGDAAGGDRALALALRPK